MGQEQLNELALRSMKRNELEAIDWDEIINSFAEAKVKKSNLNKWKMLLINKNLL